MLQEFTLTGRPAARCDISVQVKDQSGLIINNKQLVSFVESITQMVLILNKNNQIVYASESYYHFFGSLNLNCEILGKKPGDAFSCRNAFNSVNGCGTSRLCRSCGAANAILESQNGTRSTHECKILTAENNAIDLSVTASPLNIDGEELTIFSISDISHEKRRESLERVFIHDILNSAGGISGLSAILKEVEDKDEINDIADTIERAANNLIEEIQTQRAIGSAERGDLIPQLNEVETLTILKEIKNIYNKHQLNHGKPIFISADSENLSFITDRVLLKRILGNMVKNAVESNTSEDQIVLSTRRMRNRIRFSVHNRSHIPEQVQSELFKRFYSTKENGRGIGTYSMKLFGEKYLKGKVWFTSTPDEGTTFYFEV